MSAAMMALGGLGGMGSVGGYGGAALREQVGEQSDELRKKRQQEAKLAGYSPAGISLVGMGAMGL
jgi:hypothetical protein